MCTHIIIGEYIHSPYLTRLLRTFVRIFSLNICIYILKCTRQFFTGLHTFSHIRRAHWKLWLSCSMNRWECSTYSIVTTSTCLIMWNANNSLQKRPFLSSPAASIYALKIQFLHCITMGVKKQPTIFFDYLYNLKSAENYPYIHCMDAMPKWLQSKTRANTVEKRV